jgi:tetratricopeptide (TPR) repeat protein
MGLVSHHLGDDQVACQYAQEALKLADGLGNRRPQGEFLNLLGRALVGLGDLTEAMAACQRALTLCRESGQIHHAMESLAGLAEIALAQGDLSGAQAYVEEILAQIEKYKLDLLEPLRVYLTCYRVLNANQNSRAQDILATAHCLLQERVSKIADRNLRRLFLENVTVHREIRREFEKGE